MQPIPSIIYWKWDDSILTPGALEGKVHELVRRTTFDIVFVGVHWMSLPITDPRVIDKIAQACHLLHRAGRKLVMELDARNQYSVFIQRYPDDVVYSFFFAETTLDENGWGSIEFDSPHAFHYFQPSGVKGIERILGSWTFTLTEDGKAIVPGTIADVLAHTTYVNAGEKTRITVQAGAAHAHKRVAVLPAFRQAITNMFSSHFYHFYEELFQKLAHIPLDGVQVDEWGVDVMISAIDDTAVTLCQTYADGLAQLYQTHCGTELAQDLLYFKYPVKGQEQAAYQIVNDFNHVLRQKMVENETWIYNQAKRVFGPDAFVGAHPTWWGSPTKLHLEVLKNGWDWWEVPRDYGQTDETVSVPIRLALARKAGGPVWYNMWYSMGTRRLDTYFQETWRNARYGGRTHYHGFECPNEDVVLELKGPGILEEIETMEQLIRRINAFQRGLPDSRILVVFGMEAATNWVMNEPGLSAWRCSSPTQERILELSRDLFEAGYLHDLVPSTEIANGSVRLEKGKLHYGKGHTYDALIFLFPENISAEVWAFLKRCKAQGIPLTGCGTLTRLNGGRNVQDEFAQWREGLCWWEQLTEVGPLVAVVQQWGLAVNHFDSGAVFTDGSVIFTGAGVKNVGNPLEVKERIFGRLVEFSGEDFLALKLTPEGEIERVDFGKCHFLRIDGKDVEVHAD